MMGFRHRNLHPKRRHPIFSSHDPSWSSKSSDNHWDVRHSELPPGTCCPNVRGEHDPNASERPQQRQGLATHAAKPAPLYLQSLPWLGLRDQQLNHRWSVGWSFRQGKIPHLINDVLQCSLWIIQIPQELSRNWCSLTILWRLGIRDGGPLVALAPEPHGVRRNNHWVAINCWLCLAIMHYDHQETKDSHSWLPQPSTCSWCKHHPWWCHSSLVIYPPLLTNHQLFMQKKYVWNIRQQGCILSQPTIRQSRSIHEQAIIRIGFHELSWLMKSIRMKWPAEGLHTT